MTHRLILNRRSTLLSALVTSVLIVGSILVAWPSSAAASAAGKTLITMERLNIRTAANMGSDVRAVSPQYRAGTIIAGPETEPGSNRVWYQVQFFGGGAGWVSGDYVYVLEDFVASARAGGQGVAANPVSRPASAGTPNTATPSLTTVPGVTVADQQIEVITVLVRGLDDWEARTQLVTGAYDDRRSVSAALLTRQWYQGNKELYNQEIETLMQSENITANTRGYAAEDMKKIINLLIAEATNLSPSEVARYAQYEFASTAPVWSSARTRSTRTPNVSTVNASGSVVLDQRGLVPAGTRAVSITVDYDRGETTAVVYLGGRPDQRHRFSTTDTTKVFQQIARRHAVAFRSTSDVAAQANVTVVGKPPIAQIDVNVIDMFDWSVIIHDAAEQRQETLEFTSVALIEEVYRGDGASYVQDIRDRLADRQVPGRGYGWADVQLVLTPFLEKMLGESGEVIETTTRFISDCQRDDCGLGELMMIEP